MRAALLALLCGGCLSARAGIGPTITTDGDVGVEATLGLSFGLNKARSHVVFAGVDGGATAWPSEPKVGAVLMDSFDLMTVADEPGDPIVRGGLRLGLRSTPDEHLVAIGGGFAAYPITGRSSSDSASDNTKGGFDWFTTWSQWGVGVDAQFLYLGGGDDGWVGLARLAAMVEFTSLAR